MKKARPTKSAHTPKTKIGSGDYYGTGIKNKIGRIIDVTGYNDIPKSKLKKPPKSLA
jgi:hypothetical protein